MDELSRLLKTSDSGTGFTAPVATGAPTTQAPGAPAATNLLRPGDPVVEPNKPANKGKITEVTPDGKAKAEYQDKKVEYTPQAIVGGEVKRAAVSRSLSDLENEVKAAGIPLPTSGYGKKELVDLLKKYHWEKSNPGEDMPSYVEPMLLKNTKDMPPEKVKDLFVSKDWFAEQKRDGVRCIVDYDANGKPRAYSRNVSVKTYLPGSMTDVLFWMPVDPGLANTTLDGEVISTKPDVDTAPYTRGKGGMTANVLQAAVALTSIENTREAQEGNGMPLRYVIYDIVKHNGKDLQKVPYTERRKAMEAVVAMASNNSDKVILNPTTNVGKQELWESVIEQGGEGLVFKHKSLPYQPGKRPPGALKHKVKEELDCLVTGALPPKSGSYSEGGLVGGLEFSCKDSNTGEWKVVGASSAMDLATRREISVQNEDGTFKGVKDGVIGTWIYEVEFRGWSRTYRMVHARPLRRRDGAGADSKSADECVFDFEAVKKQVDSMTQTASLKPDELGMLLRTAAESGEDPGPQDQEVYPDDPPDVEPSAEQRFDEMFGHAVNDAQMMHYNGRPEHEIEDQMKSIHGLSDDQSDMAMFQAGIPGYEWAADLDKDEPEDVFADKAMVVDALQNPTSYQAKHQSQGEDGWRDVTEADSDELILEDGEVIEPSGAGYQLRKKAAKPVGTPPAPDGMKTDPDTGNVEQSEESMGLKDPTEDPMDAKGIVAYKIVFPNLERVDYSTRPYYVHNWFNDVKTAAVRGGGMVESRPGDKVVEASFRTSLAVKRFAAQLREEFGISKDRMSATMSKTAAFLSDDDMGLAADQMQSTPVRTKDFKVGDEVMFVGEQDVGIMPWDGRIVEVYQDSALVEASPGEDVPEGHREVIKFEQMEKMGSMQLAKNALVGLTEGAELLVMGVPVTLRKKSGWQGRVLVQEAKKAPMWVPVEAVHIPKPTIKTASMKNDEDWLGNLDDCPNPSFSRGTGLPVK